MALNFNEGAYGQAYQQGQQNQQVDRDRLLQLIQSVGPAISQIGQGYQQRKEDNTTLDQLLNPKGMNSSNILSQPVSPTERIDSMAPKQMMDFNQIPNNPMNIAPQPEVPQAGPRNHVEGFQNFLKGQSQVQPMQAQPTQPSPFGQYGGMTLGQLRRLPDVVQKSMFQQNKPKTIDTMLAEKIQNGEMTIEDALKMKQQQVGIINVDPSGNASQIGTAPKGSIVTRPGSGPGGNKAPAGFRFTPDGNLEMIPGGPSDIKAQLDKQKQEQALNAQTQEAQTVIGKIDSALGKVGALSSGWGSFTKNIPGSPAMDLSADLDSIHSSLGLDKLMEMKANSKAGASGMGQLSDKEMSLLIANIASLKQSQTPDQLRDKLNQVKRHYQNILQMNQGINPFQNGMNTGINSNQQQKPKTVIQNGHTYTLNEATGQYE